MQVIPAQKILIILGACSSLLLCFIVVSAATNELESTVVAIKIKHKTATDTITNRGAGMVLTMASIAAGCPSLFKIDDILKKINYLFDIVLQIERESVFKFEIVDFGAGIGVPYYKVDYDKNNFEQMLKETSELILKRRNHHWRQRKLR